MSSKAETTRIAKRYAIAGFAWAEENKKLKELEKDIAVLQDALDNVDELKVVLNTPLMNRREHQKTMDNFCKKAKVSDVLGRVIGGTVENRRLDCLPAIVAELKALIAEHKGELTVDIVSAAELSKTQLKKISDILKKQFGQSVELQVTQDKDLIGGLVIRAGSLMIDSSVKTQLEKLTRTLKNSDVIHEQETMKEVA